MLSDYAGLDCYLKKCEIEYIAENSPSGGTLDWLAPFCDSTKEIANFLRYLGFRVKRIVDEETCPGEAHQWVETTSGILVYVNGSLKGFFAKKK